MISRVVLDARRLTSIRNLLNMRKNNKKIVYLSFERYLAQQMKDKVFREAYEKECQYLKIEFVK